jgi:hypothetical protein
MRRERISPDAKGWFAGPWNSDLDVSIGFAGLPSEEAATEKQLVPRARLGL